jgi:DNA-binding GntR family transcriptional regulator
MGSPQVPKTSPATLANSVYAQLKQDLFDFRLVPGDRFSETEIAERLQVSRTPVREALFRLQHEGYLEVHFRSGWSVKPFDFQQFDHLYDLRTVLETEAVRRLCAPEFAADATGTAMLEGLKAVWFAPAQERTDDGKRVAKLDEAFHLTLINAVGNPELARVYEDLTARIRILRQLDFTQSVRIEKTYAEHAKILRCILQKRADEAIALLRTHIEASAAAVRKITLHRLYAVRQANL